jgi:hypothetical protein
MLGHLEDESVANSLDLEGVEDGREVSLELDVDDCANNLRDLSSNRSATECSYRNH